MKTLTFIFLVVLSSITGLCQDARLTMNQKIQDFDSLYYTLSNNYLGFGINKRLFGVDWISNYSKYKAKVEAANTDYEFLLVINEILNDLNSGHIDLMPSVYYDYFKSHYSKNDKYTPYLKQMTKNGAQNKILYWIPMIQKLYGIEDALISNNHNENNDSISVEQTTSHNSSNCTLIEIPKRSLCVLKIKSFDTENLKSDSLVLLALISKIKKYNKLIIDIQGNSGGDSDYFTNIIVPMLSKKEIDFEFIIAHKNTPFIQSFKPHYFSNKSSLPPSLPNLPIELKDGSVDFTKSKITIKPHKDNIHYKGEIFLLVDRDVFSSADMFAAFCQYTKFATVAGEVTAGEGIGDDPILYTLPNSGLICRFSAGMGLNADGSCNEETKTIPDKIIHGENPDERLKKLIENISFSKTTRLIKKKT